MNPKMLCQLQGCTNKISIVMQTTNKCRCQMTFCNAHRLEHGCTFDYINHDRKILQKTLVKSVPDKIIKI